MEFWVKLIEVKSTRNVDARNDLKANCTHVAGNLWLFEGDEEALHPGIKFKVVDEQAIEAHGDDSSDEIKKMVCDTYSLNDEHLLTLGCVEV